MEKLKRKHLTECSKQKISLATKNENMSLRLRAGNTKINKNAAYTKMLARVD
jgi:hypothetical protein